MHLTFVFLVNTGVRTQLVDLWPCICNRQVLMGVNGYISVPELRVGWGEVGGFLKVMPAACGVIPA